MRAVRACLVAAVVAASHAAPARAAVPTFADREAARSLADKGYDAFQAKQYAKAIDLFREAESRVHAPPHLLYIARAQFKIGRLIEAEATFQGVVDEKLAPDAPAPFRDAQASASSELREVQVLIPSVTIAFAGPLPPGARVTLDDRPLDARALAAPLRANPGPHLVKLVVPGEAPVLTTVTLRLGGGDEAHVTVPLPSGGPYLVPMVVSFALGAAFVGVGVTATILSLHATDPALSRLRVTEIAGYAAGGAGLVAGFVLLGVRVRSASATASAAPPVRVGLGVGSLTISGSF